MRFLSNLIRGAFRMAVNLVGFLCLLVMTAVVFVGVCIGYPPAQHYLEDAVEQGKQLKKELPKSIGDKLA